MEKRITNKCNHKFGEETYNIHIRSIKPYIYKGLHLHTCFEIRCKYCNHPFESGALDVKDFFNVYRCYRVKSKIKRYL